MMIKFSALLLFLQCLLIPLLNSEEWEAIPYLIGEEIEITGFVQSTDKDHFILTKQPNVKSCCFDRLLKSHEMISFKSDEKFSQFIVETLKGTLEQNDDHTLFLKNAVKLSEKNRFGAPIVFLAVFALFGGFVFYLRRF